MGCGWVFGRDSSLVKARHAVAVIGVDCCPGGLSFHPASYSRWVSDSATGSDGVPPVGVALVELAARIDVVSGEKRDGRRSAGTSTASSGC